ncbi:MAG: nicotinate phosphoribosyltransferase [Deltaproteobacteria bacterium]|nr:nicotinate phosphoribosyltransferase [Deltaproteobacteria bacterium]
MTSTERRRELLTDLYELTMAAAYHHRRMFGRATFSLFIRKYPLHRSYFVNAGIQEVLSYLEEFRFHPEDLAYLETLGLFSPDFLDYLSARRFTGDVFAIPEGRLFFQAEPVLEISAPIIEAQIVETFVLNAMNFQTTIATKAARCVWAAEGRRVVDFALRRTQGFDAGLKVARASFIAGFDATSNVLAGKEYGIPVSGTMAHSFVSSFRSELEAFRAFAEVFPQQTVLLIDTYDTPRGARKAAQVAKELQSRGGRLQGVRIDSGRLADLSLEVRRVLDESGLSHVPIFASGGLDEFQVAELVEQGAPFDGFGVGTRMGVSADAPYMDMAYKLVEYQARPLLKLSTGKVSLAGEKQIFRRTERGRLAGDVIGRRAEKLGGEPLLDCVMRGGVRTRPAEPLSAVRERFRDEFDRLDASCKALRKPTIYPVELSPGLEALQREAVRGARKGQAAE